MFAANAIAKKAAAKTYIEDVFGINLRTGTGATASVTGMPNLATYGGMVHIKQRNQVTSHRVFTASRGATNSLATNSTAATVTFSGYLTAFNSDGFSVGAATEVNESGFPLVDFIWRNAPKFFKETTVTKSAGSNATVDLSTLGVVGMVKVKRTDAAGSWYIWHRSLTAGNLLIGETTAGEAALGHITVSGTTLTLVNGVIADGTYHIEVYGHDTSADGLIQCGSFTTDGSGNASVTLGWEPQFLVAKGSNAVTTWAMLDVMRNWSAGGNDAYIQGNSSAAEANSVDFGTPTATGFTFAAGAASSTYIYVAVRRGPMRFPTSGTQVYQAIARTANNAANTISGVGFPPDLVIPHSRGGFGAAMFHDRLRGAAKYLDASSTGSESTSSAFTSITQDGYVLAGDGVGYWNFSGTFIDWCFRRYPGVFDMVCFKGTGVAHTEAHNLTVVPELMIFKNRSSARNWVVYTASTGSAGQLYLHLTNAYTADSTTFNSTAPTASVFTVGTAWETNKSGEDIVALLFATLAGISKVGSYTGNGTSQTINCGFAAGARFVLIKPATDAGTPWSVFDSVRGIVAANDPVLWLNNTTVEDGLGSLDLIDPVSSGFIVNANGTLQLNANGQTYIFFALA